MYDTYMAGIAMDDVQSSLYEVIKTKKSKKCFTKVKKDRDKRSFVGLYDELIILIRMLQIMGFFPFGRDKTGKQ